MNDKGDLKEIYKWKFKNQKSKILLASFFQPDGFFDEVVAATAAHLFQVAAFDGEETALTRTVFVDAACRRVVLVFFQERTLEQYLAARAAAIAISATKAESFDDIFPAKVDSDETPQLALRLARAKLGVFHCARTLRRRETLLKRTSRVIPTDR